MGRITRDDYRVLLDRQYTPEQIIIKKKDNPEGRTQLEILRYIRGLGYTCGKTKTVGIKRGNHFCLDPYTFTGFPDITAFVPHLVFIEVKSPTGIQSANQKSFQECCLKANVPYILARDLDDITSIIK